MAAQGIAIRNLQDLLPNMSDRLTRYWYTDAAIRQDIPSWHTDSTTLLEEFVRHPLGSHVTGVHPTWRRHGVATAFKTIAINVAVAIGHRQIETFNEEDMPLLQLKLALRFQSTKARFP